MCELEAVRSRLIKLLDEHLQRISYLKFVAIRVRFSCDTLETEKEEGGKRLVRGSFFTDFAY